MILLIVLLPELIPIFFQKYADKTFRAKGK